MPWPRKYRTKQVKNVVRPQNHTIKQRYTRNKNLLHHLVADSFPRPQNFHIANLRQRPHIPRELCNSILLRVQADEIPRLEAAATRPGHGHWLPVCRECRGEMSVGSFKALQRFDSDAVTADLAVGVDGDGMQCPRGKGRGVGGGSEDEILAYFEWFIVNDIEGLLGVEFVGDE